MDIDLWSPDTYADGVPHEIFEFLRRERPVHWHAEPDGPGFWVLAKHADVMTVSKDPATYSSALGTNLKDTPPERIEVNQASMLNMDPPRHGEYRRFVSRGFRTRVGRNLASIIRSCANRLIDAVAAAGRCDFVTDIAAPFPMQVIAELLGVPPEDRERVVDWNRRLKSLDNPEAAGESEGDLRAVATEMFEYAKRLAYDRARDPVEAYLEAEVDAHFLLTAAAGNEPTRNVISGAMLALIQHPEARARLRDDLSRIPTSVEEMLRWVTPAMYFRRTATRDTSLGGQAIRAGDKVAMYYVSANRDEEVFHDPQRFDIDRAPNDHLAFGIGEHVCWGAFLARQQLRILFESLLARLPDIELAGPIRRLRSNFMHGVEEMPVRFEPRPPGD